jgi:hypothetical protein
VRSRFGSLRTLAASHHEGNRRIATLRTRHILGGIAQPATPKKSITCWVLGIRKVAH